MNVSLTTELEQWVSEKVVGGRYKSASEVVREGLRLLQEKEEEHAARLAALRGDLAEEDRAERNLPVGASPR